MPLIATKAEVAEISALLVAGAESPEDLAKAVIKRIGEMREGREQWFVVIDLGGGAYVGRGPFATKAAAVKGAAKEPWISHFKHPWTVAATYGPGHLSPRAQEFEQEIAARVLPKGHWSKLREQLTES